MSKDELLKKANALITSEDVGSRSWRDFASGWRAVYDETVKGSTISRDEVEGAVLLRIINGAPASELLDFHRSRLTELEVVRMERELFPEIKTTPEPSEA